ncbi:MAG: ABC transporter ATP-binding protein [Candidatus Portnoybacteria bacterium]|nr:ABC transporter ATP-binding protein [Candidatus Portnoybacteria bacterium]
METALSLHHITKIFTENSRHLTVLEDISLEIFSGEFFVILGPSGSGKSTLLRIVSGLEKNYRGEVTYASTLSHSDMSFIFQQFALLPWLTVYQNVELGLVARHAQKEFRAKKVMEELVRLGLEKFTHAYPRELSGGMRQRVGIARALATDPKIIFMDEAFSELDSFTAEELRKEFLKIWQERKPTIIMVTHLIPEAIELADRIAVFTPRPGKIEKIVANKLGRPREKRSEEFYHLEDELAKVIRP